MLTKKPTPSQNKLTPGTKRSAGGLVPGRSLSRRGAPETKRSLAIGASGTHLTGVPFTKRSAPVGGGDTSPSATKLGRGVSMDRSGSRNITRRSSHAKTHSRKPSATNRATERSGLKKR